MYKEYPKAVILKDGTEVLLRLLTKDDNELLYKFFNQLPKEDRLFLKEDVTDPDVIGRWIENLDYDKVLPLIAEKDGEIVADATLHRDAYGWEKHIGEVRVVVARELQRKGLGAIMVQQLFHHALRRGLDKLQVLVMENQIAAIKAFRRVGFKKEAELKDHVIDLQGKKHNLIIMTNNVRNLVSKIDDLIKSLELKIENRIS